MRNLGKLAPQDTHVAWSARLDRPGCREDRNRCVPIANGWMPD
jgi:hypothetical protein